MTIVKVNGANLGYSYFFSGETLAFYNLLHNSKLSIVYVIELMKSEYGAKEVMQRSGHPYIILDLAWEKEEDIKRAKEWIESLKAVNRLNNIR